MVDGARWGDVCCRCARVGRLVERFLGWVRFRVWMMALSSQLKNIVVVLMGYNSGT